MSDYRALPFVDPYYFAFWGVFAWVYFMEARQHQRSQQRMAKHDGDDKYSGLVISIGSTILQVLAFALSFYEPLRVNDAAAAHAMFWVGLAMIVVGEFLRIHCWAVLGKFFTPTVTIASDHRVVDQGAYRWVRHPSYAGAILGLFGMGVALGNYGSLAVLVVGTMVVYIYRIEAEEAALEKALGDAYVKFKSNRKRLIPFVY
jgi:protein-S-isoprenylcysteine O-methyltransferase Ste14